jgi:hypothetical protein
LPPRQTVNYNMLEWLIVDSYMILKNSLIILYLQ